MTGQATSSSGGEAEGSEETARPDESGGTTGPVGTGSTGEPEPTGEHGLGTIILGETHPVGTGDALVLLSATFEPDASVPPQDCSMDVSGCAVTVALDCLPVLCMADEVCQFNDSCEATCTRICDLACPAGQECYFPFAGAPACREAQMFDAGRLDFIGTNEPFSLYPPYVLAPDVDGPLAVPDSEITLTASGTDGAGFESFEATTTSMDSVFSTVDEILPADAAGTGDLTVTWVPGADDLTVSVSVTGSMGGTGTVVCPAEDAMGSVSIPRAAINAAIADDVPTLLDFSVRREHTETTKGIGTTGQLLDAMVQPEGWVDFTYVSVETGSVIPG